MTYAGDEATYEGGHGSVVGEVFLGVLHFLLVEEAEVSEGAIGKSVDDGASEVASGCIVDKGAYIGSQRGTEDNEDYVEVAAIGGSTVGGRWHDEFAGDGNDGALERHQEGDGPVVEMVEAPGNEGGHY